MRRATAAAFVLWALMSGNASAGLLTGDNVEVWLDGSLSGSGTVGAGTDIVIGGALFDFDAGAGGSFSLSATGTFPTFGASEVSLRDLDFSGPSVLVGFDNLFSQFTNTLVSFTDNTLTFKFVDGPNGGGTIISGDYLVREVGQNAVPAPATAALLGLGLLGLRRCRKA